MQKYGCIAVARNHAQILDAFLDQLDEFFDRVVFLDHASTDDTVDLVRARDSARFEVLHLAANRVPVSDLVSHFSTNLFREGCSHVFFMETNEFLGVSDRMTLTDALTSAGDAEIIRMPLKNVCPSDLSGGDIFAQPMLISSQATSRSKAILTSRVPDKLPTFSLTWANGDISVPADVSLSESWLDVPVLKIPIESVTHAALMVAQARTSIDDEASEEKGVVHGWRAIAQRVSASPVSAVNWSGAALAFPDPWNESETGQYLDFKFPYVWHRYDYTPSRLACHIASLGPREAMVGTSSDAFRVISETQGVVLERGHRGGPRNVDHLSSISLMDRSSTEEVASRVGGVLENLVQPLFAMPSMAIQGPSSEHLPIFFVLMKMLRPSTYVEVGNASVGGLIAAACAARSYGFRCELVGVVDNCAPNTVGTEHLKDHYPNVRLVQAEPDSARQLFHRGAIDLLVVNGVRDYLSLHRVLDAWLPFMSRSGVVVVRDIHSYSDARGASRAWRDLTMRFSAIDFLHGGGLGVIFLDPDDSRVAPLSNLRFHQDSLAFYQELAALVGGTVIERSIHHVHEANIVRFERELRCALGVGDREHRDQQAAELLNAVVEQRRVVEAQRNELGELHETLRSVFESRSWRVTRPMRAVREKGRRE